MFYLLHVATVLIFPILMIGLINRAKSIWAGRKGFPIFQLYFDLRRLLKKSPVYSRSTSWLFPFSGIIFIATTFLASFIAPIFPGFSFLSFDLDFIFFAYLMALGRIFLILGSMDTASSFEGMGASREAAYSALIEPTFFITIGTLLLLTNSTSMATIFTHNNLLIILLCALALFILLQTEAARVPVDDPNTHLELTMIHEVMILDHSAQDLAMIQYGSGIKMTVLGGLIASLLNPFSISTEPLYAATTSLVILVGVAILIALVESLVARLRMRTIPLYLFCALTISVVAMSLALVHKVGVP